MTGTFNRYLLAWVPMVPIAVLNGLVREKLFARSLSELRSHQLSCLTAVALFAAYIGAVVARWPPETERQAVWIGAAWIAMTVAFEFLFGRLVAGHSWSRLFGDYNLAAGRLWTLVLLWVGIAPWLLLRLQRPR